MSAVPPAGELHASIRSWRFSPSFWRSRQRCRALCDLQQLHPDTDVPGDCMSPPHTQTHTHRNANTHRWYNNMTVYIHYRRLSRRWCSGPHCLVSGPRLSAAPRGQRSTPGLTDASTTTWSSSQRAWSAPTAHTMPPAWPSKSCMFGFHNAICSLCEKCKFFFTLCHFWMFSNCVFCFNFVFQSFSSWWIQLHCCRLYEARHVQHHQGLPHLRSVSRITQI